MSDFATFLILVGISCFFVWLLNYLRRLREEFGVYKRLAALEEAVFVRPNNQAQKPIDQNKLLKAETVIGRTNVTVTPARKPRARKPKQ